MKNVMVKAWEIAREGQKKFGGKVKEYFAEALRMAWVIVKRGMDKVKLVGTEKQVKWAEDIREKYMKVFDEFYELFKESKPARKVEDLESARKEIMETIFSETDSKYYIEKIRFIGEYDEMKIHFFLKEQLKDMIEAKHMGAIKFSAFFGGRYITSPTISNIVSKKG